MSGGVVVTLQAVRDGVFGELQLVRDAAGYLGEVFVPDPRGPKVVRGHEVDGVGFVPDHPLPLRVVTALLAVDADARQRHRDRMSECEALAPLARRWMGEPLVRFVDAEPAPRPSWWARLWDALGGNCR